MKHRLPLTYLAGAALLVALPASLAWAHRPSESHVTFRAADSGAAARVDVALRDIDWALAIDADGDGSLTWGEVVARRADIETHLLTGFSVRAAGAPCPMQAGKQQLIEHSDGPYLSVPVSLNCGASAQNFELTYKLFFDVDPQHRALVRIDDGSDKTFVLSASSPKVNFALVAQGVAAKPQGVFAVTLSFMRHGAEHIAAGFDHLLFLLLLLLPAVLRRQDGRWLPMPSLKPTVVEVAKVVTAFTSAHAITMSAAALGLVSVPSSLVEPAIALSLVIAAANNLWPIFAGGRWALPFSLGLLHGFGFSSALADLGLPSNRILPALLGFNLGVELGQLALVAAVVPVAFLFRRTRGYRSVAITGGSLAIAAVALFWFVERVLAVSFI